MKAVVTFEQCYMNTIIIIIINNVITTQTLNSKIHVLKWTGFKS